MITIDGREYDPEKLSAKAKEQIGSMQFVDNEIAKLNSMLAVLQTARLTYGRALREALNEDPLAALGKDTGTIQFS